jgi:NADH-quinone oxidoreductase subunit E
MGIDPSRVRRFAHGSRVPGWDEAADLSKDPAVVPDPATTPVPERLAAEIRDYMSRYPDFRSAAIPALHAAQRVHGWCSPTAIEQVAAVMRLTPGYLLSVASFYDMLETTPKGRHDVYVCTNISCSLMGGDQIYDAMLSAAGDDPDFNVRSFECLGACDIAPMASVDGEYVGPLVDADCAEIVADVIAGRPVLPAKQLRHRKAPAVPTDREDT